MITNQEIFNLMHYIMLFIEYFKRHRLLNDVSEAEEVLVPPLENCAVEVAAKKLKFVV